MLIKLYKKKNSYLISRNKKANSGKSVKMDTLIEILSLRPIKPIEISLSIGT